MEHNKALKKLGVFHDAALHADEAKAVSEHISACGICQAELDKIKEADSRLLSIKHESEVDPYFSARVMQRYEDRKKFRFIPVKFLPIPVALAVFVLVLTSVMITAPFVYSVDADTTKGDVQALLVGAFVPDSPAKLFSLGNIIALCNSCNTVLCQCCKNNGTVNCPVKRCMNEQK